MSEILVKKLKNTTGSDLFHTNTGVTFIAGQYTDVDRHTLFRYNDSQMWGWFNDGSVIFNDGSNDYTNKYEAWHMLFEYACGLPFLSETNSDRTNGMTSVNLQDALEELENRVAVSASPGFTWGKSGQVPKNTYLLHETVPSNIAGKVVHVTTGTITEVWVACQDDATCDIKVQKRGAGTSFSDLLTISLSSQRKKIQTFSVDVVKGDELAVKVSNGSLKNPVVGVTIEGKVT